jgi:hypothetical protein
MQTRTDAQLLPGVFERYMTWQMERDHFAEGAAAMSDGNIHTPMHDGSRSDGGWIARKRRSFAQTVKVAGAMPGIFRQALASA